MKIYALYFSPTGGTKKVLDILISAWDCEKEYIDLSDRNNASISISFASNDICVVAVPSFSGRVPQFIIPKLRKIQGKGIRAVLVTAYGNRAFDDTLLELKDTMEGCGFICSCAIAAVTRHSVLPRYGEGRPDFADIEELKQFSRKCKEIMEKSSLTVTVPGNRPYRKYVLIPINPKGNKQCINCGLC
ncbi:MAG: 4Fe-4S ferredoxin, partial [Lachnospiraceae bacterium]|nr:4Fe-4S ferredoxin [Lachnospiraceae bacterium]